MGSWCRVLDCARLVGASFDHGSGNHPLANLSGTDGSSLTRLLFLEASRIESLAGRRVSGHFLWTYGRLWHGIASHRRRAEVASPALASLSCICAPRCLTYALWSTSPTLPNSSPIAHSSLIDRGYPEPTLAGRRTAVRHQSPAPARITSSRAQVTARRYERGCVAGYQSSEHLVLESPVPDSAAVSVLNPRS